MIIGTTIFAAGLFVIAQLIIDIAYSILDCRNQDQIVGRKTNMEKEVRNTFDPNEEISMEKFQIIGLDEEPEVLARPRVSYWKKCVAPD